jgi:ketosteroid isomerase-like protein
VEGSPGAGALVEAFAFAFKESTLTFADVHVRFVKPDVAIAHAKWTMTGARTPPGMPEPREGIQTLVLTKGQNGWLIDGFQNTNSMPERPFPKGPGVPGGGPSK